MNIPRGAWKVLTGIGAKVGHAFTALAHLLRDTFALLRRYRAYSLYPLLSFALVMFFALGVVAPLVDAVLGFGQQPVLIRLFFTLIIYLLYIVMYFVMTFFNVALLAGIASHLDGERLPLGGGMLRAARRGWPILIYTGAAATKGALTVLIRVVINPLIGIVSAGLSHNLWTRWRHLSYDIPLLMAVPVIALGQPIPRYPLLRSGRLVKQTWGERVKPAHDTGLLAALVLVSIVLLPSVPLIGGAAAAPTLTRLRASILLFVTVTLMQLGALASAVVALAAYRYATRHTSDVFPGDASYAAHAFLKIGRGAQPDTKPTSAPADMRADTAHADLP
jgi:hypothetical protein